MYSILAFGYEFLSEFVPFLILLLFFRRARGKYAAHFSKSSFLFPILFALYIMAVFYVTGAGTLYDAQNRQWEIMKEHINLIPFSNQVDVKGYLLNILMLVPLGFLVPLIWKDMAKPSRVLLTGFAFSLLIEVSQLLCSRGTDVDDLIMNTLGALIGFLGYKVWDKVTHSKYQPAPLDPRELPAYILTIYLGRCLLFNRLGLIHLIYGY